MQTAVTDLSTSKVTVTGTMEANKLVDYVYRRTKKQAKIVPQPEPEPEPAKVEEKPAEEAKPAEEKKEEEKPAEEDKKEGGGDNPEKNEKKEDEGHKEVVENIDIINTIDEENMKRMMHYYDQPLYVIERIPPPQLFSDENPNACCIS